MKQTNSKSGALAGIVTYMMWGMLPMYWKLLKAVSALQILAHRIVWASLLCLILVALLHKFDDFLAIFSHGKKTFLVLFSSLFITANWGTYIFAVNMGKILECSLGYFINPILSVLLGALFFKEKLDKWTIVSLLLATTGILGATILYGSVPWIALVLAFTFAIYGAAKKKAGLDPIVGLTAETCLAAPTAIIFLLVMHSRGQGAFLTAGASTTLLLMTAGIVTAVPLMLFARAANTISMQLLGFIQFLSPVIQVGLGVFVYKEKPSQALIFAFCGVVAAALLYSTSRFFVAQPKKA